MILIKKILMKKIIMKKLKHTMCFLYLKHFKLNDSLNTDLTFLTDIIFEPYSKDS